jgi:hypothetical protein
MDTREVCLLGKGLFGKEGMCGKEGSRGVSSMRFPKDECHVLNPVECE